MLIKKYLQNIPVKTPTTYGTENSKLILVHVDKSKQCGEVLVVEIFKEKNLVIRFYTDGKNWISLLGDGSWSRRQPFQEYERYQEEKNAKTLTLNIIGDLLPNHYKKNQYVTAQRMIESFIRSKTNESRQKSAEKKQERMNQHIALFPKDLTPAIKQYVNDVVIQNRYIIMNKELKQGKTQYRCLGCGKKFNKKERQRHRSRCICPKCNKEGIIIAERYIRSVNDKAKMLLFNRLDNTILKEYITLKRWYDEKTLKEQFSHETDRYEVIENEKIYRYKWMSMYWVGWCETRQEDTEKRFVYADNLDEVFPDYKALNLKRLRYAGAINFDRLMYALSMTNTTAKLYKIGLYKLAEYADLLTPGDTFESVTGVSPNYRPLFRKYNVTYQELKMIRLSDCYVNEELLLKIRELIGEYGTPVEKIEQVISWMSFTKMVNYFTKQKQREKKNLFSTALTWYIDYIRMTEELNKKLPKNKKIDMGNKKFRFPLDLKKAHDSISMQLVGKNNTSKNRRLRQIKREIEEQYKLSSDQFVLIIPKNVEDFIYEGNMLHHCIGSGMGYIDAHIKRERMSFFIRKKDTPEKPYYTFTINMEKMTLSECYGAHHKAATKEILEFIDKFIHKLKGLIKEQAA